MFKESTSNKIYSEQSVIGKVKWFNVKAGFGFINRNDNGQDVYAHYSSIENKNPNHRVRSLADGELVRFNIIEGSKGAEASDITGVDGGAVQGSEYARPKSQSLTSTGKRNMSKDSYESPPAYTNRSYPQQKFNKNSGAPVSNYRQSAAPLLQGPPMRQNNYISPKQNRRGDSFQNGMPIQPMNNYGRVQNHSNYYPNQYNDNNQSNYAFRPSNFDIFDFFL